MMRNLLLALGLVLSTAASAAWWPIVGAGTPAPTPLVANQSAPFGALTDASAGDWDAVNTGGSITSATIDSGDASNHFDIEADGTIIPTAGGATADLNLGPYTLGVTFTNAAGSDAATITATVEAATYSVSTVTELSTVLAFSSATLSGKTIKFRPGTYTNTINMAGKYVGLSSPLTIESHDHNNMARYSRWDFSAVTGVSGNVDFRYMHFFHLDATFTDPDQSWIIRLGNSSSTATFENIGFYNCEFSSDVETARGGYDATNHVRAIFTEHGVDNLIIQESSFHHLVHGIGIAGTNIEITENEFAFLWADAIDIWPGTGNTDTDTVLIEGNYSHDQIGDASGTLGQHSDFIQAYARGGQSGADISNVTVRGNVHIMGLEGVHQLPYMPGGINTGPLSQGMLIQDLVGGIYDDWLVENNIFVVDALNGITIEEDTVATVSHNTLIRVRPGDVTGDAIVDEDDGFQVYTTPIVKFNTSDAGSVIEHNASEGVTDTSGLATLTGNYTGLTPTLSTYTDAFNSSTFHPLTYHQAIDVAAPKAAGPLDTVPVKGAIDGTYDFTAARWY